MRLSTRQTLIVLPPTERFSRLLIADRRYVFRRGRLSSRAGIRTRQRFGRTTRY